MEKETKLCKACGIEKRLCEFWKTKDVEDGYRNRCIKCHKDKLLYGRWTTEKLRKEILEQKEGHYELIGEYVFGEKLKVRHNVCNTIWEVNISNVFKRNCGHCNMYNKSSMASKFEKLLIENSICYKAELVFSDCRDKMPLPFDYGIYDCNSNLLFLIELDGEQHFKDTGYGGKRLSEIKKRDEIKNNYCFNNNITLHRIDYTQEDFIDEHFNRLFENLIGCCEKNYLGYISKSIITEQLSKDIREKYLFKGVSMKSISRDFGISENTVKKVILYKYFPDVCLEIKEEIMEKYKGLQTKSLKIHNLSTQDIEEIKELKRKGISTTKIAKLFNVCRKGIPLYIDGWEDIESVVPKRGVNKKVLHIPTGKKFESLRQGCEHFQYTNYDQENYRTREKRPNRKFDFI